MFEQAAKLFESAMQAGIKIQEQSAHSLSEMLGGFGSPQQWQQRTQAAVEEAMATAQKSFDEAIQAMNENAKASVDMLQKAFEARHGESASDTQARTREMWETAIGSLRRNTEVMLQANNRVMESWREMAGIMRGQSGETNGED
jgi:hypothetical protein